MVQAQAVRQLSYVQAVNEALRQEMQRDPTVFIMGEDHSVKAGDVETDPEKRHQLMQEHMQAMQEGMQVMNQGMGMKKNKKMTDHQDKGMPEKMGDMDMKKRMDMMEKRMGMMQMMIGQMMDHESESKKTPVHKHKK